MIYQPGLKEGPYKVLGVHDPDNTRPMKIVFKPSTWTAATVYQRKSKDSYDVVVPATFTGLYHRVVNPGKSHATVEPAFSRTVAGITEDFEAGKTEGLTWEAMTYDLMPLTEDITAKDITCTNGVTLITSAFSVRDIDYTIDKIGSTAAARTTKSFQIHIHVTTTLREFDITFEFKLGEW
jgi:hypothetical protein